jgi:methyl-accepting chemotaxis protein
VAGVARFMRQTLAPHREQIFQLISEFVQSEARRLEDARVAAARQAASTQRLVLGAAAGAVVLAAALALLIGRGLTRDVGGAVHQVQGSATELRASATEQANGAKEQSAAMAQIAATINELLASSRQIAERAQRVSEVARRTAGSGRSGGSAMSSATESVTAIRRQIDAVVAQMTELGRTSQQMGRIVEIATELAEQTNLIAINATIEAAGATDAGRRFAVVADEIRKLANRMGESTKQVRALVEEVRSATHATIVATESASKSVDAGARVFGQVATSFDEIVALVRNTTDAARDIELSTKQQSSAVEQVNVAIGGLVESTRDSEASSARVLHTASELNELASALTRLVRPRASA